jgi:hypothetical protein
MPRPSQVHPVALPDTPPSPRTWQPIEARSTSRVFRSLTCSPYSFSSDSAFLSLTNVKVSRHRLFPTLPTRFYIGFFSLNKVCLTRYVSESKPVPLPPLRPARISCRSWTSLGTCSHSGLPKCSCWLPSYTAPRHPNLRLPRPTV